MDNYINRYGVLNIINDAIEYNPLDYVKACSDMMEAIAKAPAADVAPVRHGRWIEDSDGLTICSECEEAALQRVFIKLPEKIVDLQMRKSHYCPNCGAKMDGGDSDER